MELMELMKKRYSCRRYQSKPVEPEKLEQLLEAARVAPSACNRQPYKLIVVQSEAGLAKLAQAGRIFGAPLCIIVCGDHDEAWRRPFDNKGAVDIDTSIVTTQMMLAATELGLDSVWVCYFKPDVVRREFGLPDNLEPVSLLVLGYGDEDPKSPHRHVEERKPMEATVCYEAYTP